MEDGWFLFVLILCIISWMTFFVASLLVSTRPYADSTEFARTHNSSAQPRTRTRQIAQKEHLTSAQSYVHTPFKRHSAWQMLWAGSAFMTVCTTMFLSWDWLEERIIYPIRSQLRWRAEQRRADAGKLV